ncbi:hypothetical protein D3C77_204960 [compost metagenome]
MDLTWKKRFDDPNDWGVPNIRVDKCTNCNESAVGVNLEFHRGEVGFVCYQCISKLIYDPRTP